MIELPSSFIDSLNLSTEAKEALVIALNSDPVCSIRQNPFKQHDLFKDEEQVPWSVEGKYLKERPSFVADPLFHAGVYYSQEASSMFLEQILKAIDLEGKVVLDLCASPGGKSTHINSLLPKSAFLVANEIIRSRAWILKENLVKWGSSNCAVTNNDPEDFKEYLGFFDVVLADAPCSGEGMFRKDQNARKEWNLRGVDICYARQQKIIADIIPTIKDGGVLIYSTCTFNDKENKENLAWIEENYNVEGFDFVSDAYCAENSIEIVEVGGLKGYQFFPGKTKGEGFFISAIKVFGGRHKLKMPKRIRNVRLDKWDSQNPLDNGYKKYVIKDMVHSFPEEFEDIVKCMLWELKPLKIGCELGQDIKGKLKYSHELAFSHELDLSKIETVEVSKEEAIKFLQKKDLSDVPDIKSYGLITYKNQGLGWVKKVGNRLNNNYPKEFRIRKEF